MLRATGNLRVNPGMTGWSLIEPKLIRTPTSPSSITVHPAAVDSIKAAKSVISLRLMPICPYLSLRPRTGPSVTYTAPL